MCGVISHLPLVTCGRWTDFYPDEVEEWVPQVPQVGVLADLCLLAVTAQVSEYRDLWHRAITASGQRLP